MRLCKTCKVEKLLSEFSLSRPTVCRACERARQRRQYRERTEQLRAWHDQQHLDRLRLRAT